MHSLFLDLLMNVLENPKKAGVIYSAEKDINFMLQVFRQSFQMPPAYIEQVSKLIQGFWIFIVFFSKIKKILNFFKKFIVLGFAEIFLRTPGPISWKTPKTFISESLLRT